MRDEPQYLMITTWETMKAQAGDAVNAIRAANGGTDPPTLRDAHDIHPDAFAALIEALVALGFPVAEDMQTLAGLRPVGEVTE